MSSFNVELPSNKKFGIFFSTIFLALSVYLFLNGGTFSATAFVILSILFLIVAIFRPDYLLLLNKLWMRLGVMLGMIINPMVLGVLYFGVFWPLGFIMRLVGRDELRLKLADKSTYWIIRDSSVVNTDTFKQQF